MLKRLSILLFAISLISAVGAQASWSDAMLIANGNAPDIAIDRNSGYAHILNIGSAGLVYTLTDPDGTIISQESVPGAGGEVGGLNFGASVAVDSYGNPHVVYRNTQEGSPPYHQGYYIYKRTDGTWSSPIQLYDWTERGYVLRVAIDSYDNVHIIHSKHVSDGNGNLNYYRYKNGSLTGQQTNFVGGSAYRTSDRAEIDVTGSGKIYIILGNPVDGRNLQLFMSPDQGNTFSHIGSVHESDLLEHTGSPDVFVSDDGYVHIGYGSDRDPQVGYGKTFRYAKWVNDTPYLSGNVSESGELDGWGGDDATTNHGIGSLAASDDSNYLIAIYSKSDGGQLRFRYSSDGGQHWTAPSQLAAAAGGSIARDKPLVRAYNKRFYAVYSSPDGNTYLRIYTVPGFDPPVANAGGPYSGVEGTPVTFNAGLSSDDKGISKYEWDWNNDGSYDDQTSSATIQHTFADNYFGTVKLKVTDQDNMTDIAQTTVSISNANPSPSFSGSVSGNEGSSISFSVSVNDPGTNDGPFTYQWNFGDGQTSTQSSPSHIYADDGNYNVTVSVRDKDSGLGQANTTASISNVNPTANAGGPYSGRIQVAVTLSGSATDPGTADQLSYSWDANNDGTYELNGQTASAYFNSPGSHTVRLKVTDGDGGIDYDDATVTIDTESPTISTIPDQIVNEGTPFTKLRLDEYVQDLDNPDNQLTWTYSGNDSLTVSLVNREVTVTVPYDEWAGAEYITFRVEDPDQHQAQQTVKYQVNAVNDPPVLGNISDQFINEDDTLNIYWNNLTSIVTDPDNSKDDLQFEVINSSKIHSYRNYQDNALSIYAEANWYGQETVTMKVSDGSGGFDTRDFKVYVSSQPDAPLPFSVTSPLNESFSVWPSSMFFQWESTTDPDQGETVSYVWQLSKYQTFQSIMAQSSSLLTNSYTFNKTQQIAPGPYYWRVQAIGSDGNKCYSTNYGQILFDAQMPVVSPIPNQTIMEGGSFQPIQLDSYVHDSDNADNEIVWQAYGQMQLNVSINNRIATVTMPTSDWYGVENIIFEATDPIGLKDSATVTFTVTDVNAKPVLRSPGTITFYEDYDYTLARVTMEGLVTDADNSGSDFTFSLAGNRKVKYSMKSNGDMLLFASPDTCGNETVLLIVDDGAGAKDSASVQVQITPVPDPPGEFSLLNPSKAATFITWFPAVDFMWTEAVDPDPGQDVYYLWKLGTSSDFTDESSIVAQATITNKTSYVYIADRKIPGGLLYWKVTAAGTDGYATDCNEIHMINLTTGVEDGDGSAIPKEYKLLQNHPNPFNSDTQITYHLPKTSNVKVLIYNSLGQVIHTLIDEEMQAGVHRATWNGRDKYGQQVSSGIYFYQLQAGKTTHLKKMILIQ